MTDNDTKTKGIRLGFLLLTLAFGLFLSAYHAENPPIPQLDVSRIREAYIYSRSGKDLAQLTEEDTATLLKKMSGIKIFGKRTEKFKDYVGVQWRMFHFVMKDGTELGLSAANPFWIINGEWGYPCNYSDCENLSNFYHSIVGQYFNVGVQ